MSETITAEAQRIINVLRKIVVDHIKPDNNRHMKYEIRYNGTVAHPLMGSQYYVVGNHMGRYRSLDELFMFLGERGYIDTIEWYPRGTTDFLQIAIHYGGEGLSVTNCLTPEWIKTHFIGLPGAKWINPDQVITDETRVRHHIVESEEQLIEMVVKLLEVP